MVDTTVQAFPAGLKGDKGDSGTSLSVVTPVALTKGQVVCVTGSGLTVADNTVLTHMDKVIGVSHSDAIIGSTVEIITSGGIVTGITGLTVGEAYYLSTNGALTTVAPTTGFAQKIGVAQSTTTLALNISHTITLDNVTATKSHQLVNNRTGSTLLKGQVVYINGAQGSRVTVALAKADSEITSARTIGIVENDILDNASGYIITEGLIENVNTSSATADGSVVYLSPTVAGGLVYDSHPTQPNHIVIIGIVSKKHASTGSIFIKVINGFELNELHNVLITNPTDGQFLRYQASTGLWINSN